MVKRAAAAEAGAAAVLDDGRTKRESGESWTRLKAAALPLPLLCVRWLLKRQSLCAQENV